MKQAIKITVVIPTYNAQIFLKACVDSVLHQTFLPVEIIIVDDGSRDQTEAAAHELMKAYQGQIAIRYIKQDNSGPAKARNTGIKAAKGEWIAFLDADDTWMPQKLQLQNQCLYEDPEASLICTGRLRRDEETGSLSENCIGKYLSKDLYKDLWCKGNFIVTSSVLVKRQHLFDVGLFDESKNLIGAEDYDVWLRVLERFKGVYLNKPLVEYCVSQQGLCRSNFKRAFSSLECVIKKNEIAISSSRKDANFLRYKRWGLYHLEYGLNLWGHRLIAESRDRFMKAWIMDKRLIKALKYLLLTLLPLSLTDLLRKRKR